MRCEMSTMGMGNWYNKSKETRGAGDLQVREVKEES